MKYIRRFNESVKSDLEELCNNYLSFLKDDGYYFTIHENQIGYSLNIMKKTIGGVYEYPTSGYFKWEDVKDDIIPFMRVLDGSFKLYEQYAIELSGYNYVSAESGKAVRKLYKKRTIFRDGVNYDKYINGVYIIIEK